MNKLQSLLPLRVSRFQTGAVIHDKNGDIVAAMYQPVLAEAIVAAANSHAALAQLAAFLACCMKSGEGWSETCERQYTEAFALLNEEPEK